MNISAEELQNTNPGAKDINKGPLCPYCGQHSKLVPATTIYQNRKDIDRNLWICASYPSCDAFVGTHEWGAWQNFPLGILANRELRELKKRCHILFDNVWKTKKVTRSNMYLWLQTTMGLSERNAHIGELNKEQCHDLMYKLNQLYSEANQNA